MASTALHRSRPGIGDDTIARKTLAQGAFDYIAKPIDLDYLKWGIEAFLLIRS